MKNFSWRVKICMRHSTFVVMKRKAGDDTQDSTDRKEARVLELDGWAIRLPALIVQLKLLKKLYATAKHWKRMYAVFAYAQIILARKVGRKEKRERVRGGKSLQGTLLIILMNRTIRAMRWLELLGLPGQMTHYFLFFCFFHFRWYFSPPPLISCQQKELFGHKIKMGQTQLSRECFHRDRKQWIGAG